MRLIYLMSLFLMVESFSVWTGQVNNEWSNPLNWSPVGVPCTNNNIFLPTNSTIYIDQSLNCSTIDIIFSHSSLIINLRTININSFNSEGDLYLHYSKLIVGDLNLSGNLTLYYSDIVVNKVLQLYRTNISGNGFITMNKQ